MLNSLVLAAVVALNQFSIIPAPAGITSTFSIQGYTHDGAPTQTPVLDQDAQGNTVYNIRFTPPLTGECLLAEVVKDTKTGKTALYAITDGQVTMGESFQGQAPAPSKDDISDDGGTENGHNLMALCLVPDDPSSVIFSNVYHIEAQTVG